MLHSCVPFVPLCQPCKIHSQLSAMYPSTNIMFSQRCGHPRKGVLQHAPQLCAVCTHMQPCKRHIRLSAMYTSMNITFLVSCGQPWKGFLQHASQLCPIHTHMPPCNLPTEDGCMHVSAPPDTSHSNSCFKGLQSPMDLLCSSLHSALMRPRCIHACCKQQQPQKHMIIWHGSHAGTSSDMSHAELSVKMYQDPGLDRRISAVSQRLRGTQGMLSVRKGSV